MNNLDKIKLTISARDSHGQYGMYREVEDSTTRKEVLERIIKALDERYKAQEIKEIEIYRMIWSSISDSTKRVIDLFENEDMKDEKYIVIEYL